MIDTSKNGLDEFHYFAMNTNLPLEVIDLVEALVTERDGLLLMLLSAYDQTDDADVQKLLTKACEIEQKRTAYIQEVEQERDAEKKRREFFAEKALSEKLRRIEATTVTREQIVRAADLTSHAGYSTTPSYSCFCEFCHRLGLDIVEQRVERRECKMCGGSGTHVPEEEFIRRGSAASVYDCRYCKGSGLSSEPSKRSEVLNELSRLEQEIEAASEPTPSRCRTVSYKNGDKWFDCSYQPGMIAEPCGRCGLAEAERTCTCPEMPYRDELGDRVFSCCISLNDVTERCTFDAKDDE